MSPSHSEPENIELYHIDDITTISHALQKKAETGLSYSEKRELVQALVGLHKASSDEAPVAVTNALNIVINSMQGTSNINTGNLLGKSFGLVLTPTGQKEFIDIDSVPKMNFGEKSREQSIRSYFIELFSELSADPVKVGESWTVQSKFNEISGVPDLLIKLESQNTLDGLETIEGMECARIVSQYTGTVSGSGSRWSWNAVPLSEGPFSAGTACDIPKPFRRFPAALSGNNPRG